MAKINAVEISCKAIHIHPTMKNYKPRVDKDTGKIAKTSFVDNLNLRIIISYVDSQHRHC